MRIFYRDDVINFIDDNNVIVGFDYYSLCCESYGVDIMTKPTSSDEDVICSADDAKAIGVLSGYYFDTTYFSEEGLGEDYEYAFFRLLHKEKPPLYLQLYNIHNGYYAHGFDAFVDGKVWVEGRI